MIKKLLIKVTPESDWQSELGLTFLRVFTGLTMAFAHGINKWPPSEGFIEGVAGLGFPMPTVFAWLATLAELAGGVALAIGLLTRPAALMIGFTMAVAAFGRHAEDPFKSKELSLLYLAVCIFFIFRGSNRLSVDRFIK